MDHKITLRVRFAETDAMGVVYYANYYVWFELARAEFLRDLGYPYAKLQDEGVLLPVVESHCRYKRPARYDEQIVITCTCGTFSRASAKLSYRVENLDTGEHLAEGWTLHAIVGKDFKRVNLKEANPAFYQLMEKETCPE